MSPDEIPEDEDMNTITADTAETADLSPKEATEDAASHIAGLRERLDEIDAHIIELWLERAAISQEVGRTRVASGGTRLVLNRENEILDRYRSQLGADGVQLALLVLRAGRGPL
jgi:chorismate mutase